VAVSLDSAIDDAPVHQIRFALKELARSQATAKAYLEKTFTLPIVGSNSRKRKAFDVCGHCSEEYTVSDNEKGCCNYHPGMHSIIGYTWSLVFLYLTNVSQE
jgi:hypothetical protein